MARSEAAVWGRFSGIYDTFMKKDMPAYSEIIERIKKRLEPKLSVLEVAAGTGILSLGIAGNVDSVEAVDLSPDMVAEARKKARRLDISNVRFSVQDACILPYQEKSFDVVIIANTLHVMLEPKKCWTKSKSNENGRLSDRTHLCTCREHKGGGAFSGHVSNRLSRLS